MRFLVDMNMSHAVARGLRDRGHDAIHLREQGLQSLDDPSIFRKAAAEGRIVITFDLDFGEIVAFSRDRGSVILLRMHFADTATIMRRIESAIADVGPELVPGTIVIVEDHRIRTRKFLS